MLQNTSKTLGFQKIMVYKTPPGGGKPYLARGLLTLTNEFSYPLRRSIFIWTNQTILKSLRFFRIFTFIVLDILDIFYQNITALTNG